MKSRASWFAWPTFALGATGALAAILLGPVTQVQADIEDPRVIEQVLLFTAFTTFGLVGALVASKQPVNPLGWIMLGLSTLAGIGVFADRYAVYGFAVNPGSPGAIWAAWLAFWFWFPLIGSIPFVFLYFPTGRLLSRRWAIFPWTGGLSVGALTVILAVSEHLEGDGYRVKNPLGIGGLAGVEEGTPGDVVFPFLLIALVGGVASLVVRFRRSKGPERYQLKWFTYAAAVMGAGIVGGEATNALGLRPPSIVEVLSFDLPLAFLPIAIGVAILRYRLYDIDLVINKTLVYGALAAFITALYVGIVVGVGSLVGAGDEPNLALSILATALVAVVFQPVRHRIQSLANRLVFGQRLSPYEAVAAFSRGMSESIEAEQVLPRMAEAAALAVGAQLALVTLELPSGETREGSFPTGMPADSFDLSLPVAHQGERVGEISIAKKRGETPTEHDRDLLADLASQAGVALKNLRLTEELRHRLLELQESRKRIVEAQDAERRRMERDIHDGAQQQLVAMAVKLGLANNLAASDPDKAGRLLDDLKKESQAALDTLRDLARGLFPQVLVDEGLGAALAAHVRKSQIPAEVEDVLDGARFDPEIEANVYFCVREALQNASKHAPGAPVTIRLWSDEASLNFSVADRGPGFIPTRSHYVSGLNNMADRIESIDGTLEINSVLGRGTEIRGAIPTKVLEPAGAPTGSAESAGSATHRISQNWQSL